MAERSFGPVVVRRRLGSELRRLRGEAGMSLDQAARGLEVSPSKLSRLENGESPPKLWDVRNLLTLYGVEDEGYRRRAERWVNEGKSEGYWHPFSDAVVSDLDLYLSLEAEADSVSAWSVQSLHGLVQTETYARVYLREVLPGLDHDTVEGLVQVRVRRQEVIYRTDEPVRLQIVVDESALRRNVGSDDVMQEQLGHLRDLGDLVDLRVRPFNAGPHIAMISPFTIFYPRERAIDPVVVNVENAFHDAYWEGPVEVARYESAFQDLRESAFSNQESAALIDDLMRVGEG